MTSATIQPIWNTQLKIQSLPKTVIALPTKEGYELVKEESILYCKAEGNYTMILFTNSKSLLISRKLKDTANCIEGAWFLRIHQSFMVNMRFAKKYIRKNGGKLVLVDDTILPISKKYKEQVLKLFKFV